MLGIMEKMRRDKCKGIRKKLMRERKRVKGEEKSKWEMEEIRRDEVGSRQENM